ncbi:hypothetical protein PP7435_CHR1-0065 [Komagataella phaffii CBS 7435]|uniref:DUF221-domain-containing protein n=2 Tax=Komagataella phaffii TaxID=460519 RepID=C4QV51_KOMPG|nr:Membrane protein of unknown function [Komagataella phaffii GS115]AOA61619.1 GQ67_02320T0 [Komagataella phaffii]CAH2445776.1 hypothetical protein BQ9382_C1-0325 [Komagataella phaffii CBS 7435]AOA65492.1 GQ68_02927T0 [Komagataella phaffii GS115]CAY67121.1 Membrane protein of unknown function [Komagataella phaffii GS115]CCA36234.1 hypothetical protein PP7435_CHR1-0065 [Komagataella phaffii CBS 7435]
MTTEVNISTETVLTSLAVNSAVFGGFVVAFILLRAKFHRIYQPKSFTKLLPPEDRPKPVSVFAPRMIWDLIRKDKKFLIKFCGIDGYLFLRYMGILTLTFFFGSLILIVLLPVNAVNGVGHDGFDQLAIQNVDDRNRYFAHAFISWVFYGSILYVIYRELYFYNNMRVVIMSSPLYGTKQSSKSVIFQTATPQFLFKSELRKLFDGVKNVWVLQAPKDLAPLVNKRDQVSMKLENAICKILTQSTKRYLKSPDTFVEGTSWSDYVKKRPTTRSFPIFGKKYDLIDHCKTTLIELNEKILDRQANYEESSPVNSVVVEFISQYHAQLAHQSVAHHMPLHFTPSHIGVEPADINWFNMRLSWWERLVRSWAAVASIIALVIFWSIPVSFVGMISNITYLTNELPWLRWILDLPDQLLGIVTSLLPTIMLALLMMILPIFIRNMAKLYGSVTSQSVELFTQQTFFAFQVVQVFLVVSLSSAAASAVTQIIEDPTSIMDTLATNLPKASNFYIAYIILQGLSGSSSSLFQVANLILYYVFGFAFDNTPRKKHDRYAGLGSMEWGTTFPVYTNLAVIVLSYSIISPLILIFGTVAFALLWFTYMYNLSYVFVSGPDSQGLHYPRALFQTLVGVYLGEICLLGIFAVGRGWGPIVLEIILLAVTVFVHLNMNSSFDRLLSVVPADAMKPLDGVSETPSWVPSGDVENSHNFNESPFLSEEELPKKHKHKKRKQRSLANVPLLVDGEDMGSSITTLGPLDRFFRPWIYYSYETLRTYLPESYQEPTVTDEKQTKHAYDYPSVTQQQKVLWIPKDPLGFSSQLIQEFKGVIEISHERASINNKGKVEWEGDAPTSGSNVELDKSDKQLVDS